MNHSPWNILVYNHLEDFLMKENRNKKDKLILIDRNKNTKQAKILALMNFEIVRQQPEFSWFNARVIISWIAVADYEVKFLKTFFLKSEVIRKIE